MTSNSQYKLDPQSAQKKCLFILPLPPTVSKVLGSPGVHLISMVKGRLEQRANRLLTFDDLERITWDHHICHTRCTAPFLAVLAVAEGLQRNISYTNFSWRHYRVVRVISTGVFITDIAAQAASLDSSHIGLW